MPSGPGWAGTWPASRKTCPRRPRRPPVRAAGQRGSPRPCSGTSRGAAGSGCAGGRSRPVASATWTWICARPPSRGQRQRRPPAALLGPVTRRGRFRLRGWTVAASAFGDLDLDLREATIEGPATAVTALVAFGTADIYVPEGVSVDVSGVTISGHRREWGRDSSRPDAPLLRVRVVGCFGTVDVWRVPRDVHGSYREIFRQVKERQRQLPG